MNMGPTQHHSPVIEHCILHIAAVINAKKKNQGGFLLVFPTSSYILRSAFYEQSAQQSFSSVLVAHDKII